MGESYILMAITKMNIDKGSAPVLVQGVSRGPRKRSRKKLSESYKTECEVWLHFHLVFTGYHRQDK